MLRNVFISIFAVLFFVSCRFNSYLPNSANMPLFREERELQMTGCITLSRTFGMAALSLNPFLATQFSQYREYSMNNNDINENTFTEFGIGYYKPLGRDFSFEVFTGAGKGDINITYHKVTLFSSTLEKIKSASADYSSYFIQPDIGFVHKNIKMGYGIKLNYVAYNKYYYENNEYRDARRVPVVTNETLSDDRMSFFVLNPTCVFEAGFKHIKFHSQVSTSIFSHKSRMDNSVHPFSYPINVNIGISLFINFKRKEK